MSDQPYPVKLQASGGHHLTDYLMSDGSIETLTIDEALARARAGSAAQAPTEAVVTINGRTLTDSETSALRVAVSSFRSEMVGPNPLGGDAHGIAMAAGYARNLQRVEMLLVLKP